MFYDCCEETGELAHHLAKLAFLCSQTEALDGNSCITLQDKFLKN